MDDEPVRRTSRHSSSVMVSMKGLVREELACWPSLPCPLPCSADSGTGRFSRSL